MTSIGNRKVDLEVRAIRKGQIATFEVEGGFVRKEAPCDGLYVETTQNTFILPKKHVLKILQHMRKATDTNLRVDLGSFSVRGIRAGENEGLAVEGGYMWMPSPCDGLLVETPHDRILIPAALAVSALQQLQPVPERQAPPKPSRVVELER